MNWLKELFKRSTTVEEEAVIIDGEPVQDEVEIPANPVLKFLDQVLDAAEAFVKETPGQADDKFVAWLRGLYEWLDDNLEAIERAVDFIIWVSKNRLFAWVAKRVAKL